MIRWRFDIVLACGLLAVTATLTTAPVRAIDLAARDLADTYRPRLGYDVAVTVNRLGSGGWLAAIAAVTAVTFAIRRRSLWPLAPVAVAAAAVAGCTEPIKLLVHRAAPHVTDADGVSFPSGHAVNTVVWYGVLCLLAGAWLHPTARMWLRWTPPLLVGVANAYLQFHWITDLVAGFFLGVLIDRQLARVRWPRLDQTRRTSTPAACSGANAASVASASVTNV